MQDPSVSARNPPRDLPPALLLRNVSLDDGRGCDVRIATGRIEAIGPDLPSGDAVCLDADGACLLPALKDHHLHLYATAAARASVACGAPQVQSRTQLQAALQAARPDATGWIRGVDFHPRLCGELDLASLDAWVPQHPLRIAHASGRLWYLNTAAMQRLGEGPWETLQGRRTGRLVDADAWLRTKLPSQPPRLKALSRQLARWGVVAVTDTGPANDRQTLALLREARASGELLQRVQMMGTEDLHAGFIRGAATAADGIRVAALKIHLLESELPDFEGLCACIRRSHALGRPVAFHCVSRLELVFALSALDEVGSLPGDRIEHAGICPDEALLQIRRLRLSVVTQPGFISARGDRYLAEVSSEDQPFLYRLASFLAAGVPLAGSSDAPYGELNPWSGMQAAISRRTQAGKRLGAGEALSPEQALALYTGELATPGVPVPPLRPGQVADLCLLDRSWERARQAPAEVSPRLTLLEGRVIWSDVQSTAPDGHPIGRFLAGGDL